VLRKIKNFNFKVLKLLSSSLLTLSLVLTASGAHAQSFSLGETVFVAFPQANIKDDAFIVGQVTAITQKGDFQIAVQDYVEGHDYGSSCVPISKNTQDQGLGSGWEIWQDTTKLDTKQLEYIVPKSQVMKLDDGKHYFVERNNVYIVFGRWKSDAPMLTVERLQRAEREAQSAGLKAMLPAFELAILHRKSFYGDYGRPLMAFEAVAPLNKALNAALELFQKDQLLESLWRAKPRNWEEIGQSSRHYFAIEAIDKIVEDAQDQLYEEGLEKAEADELQRLREKLTQFKR